MPVPEATWRRVLSSFKGNGSVTARTSTGKINGLFDNEFIESLDTEARVPVFTCMTSDAAEMRKGSEINIDGNSYSVRRHERDGTGMSRLILE